MSSPQKAKAISKHPKHKKDKKQKKDRQRVEKHNKKQKKNKRDKRDKSQQQQKSITPQYQQQQIKTFENKQIEKQQIGGFQERTHVNCRRCKEPTFSLKSRTCSNCGYPKQQRPKYFPVTKQINVMQLVKQGRLIHNSFAPVLIQVVVNDRFGKKQRIKCYPTDTIYEVKKLISAQIGTRSQKIRLQKANIIFKDHLTLDDYQIKDGCGLEMYYD